MQIISHFSNVNEAKMAFLYPDSLKFEFIFNNLARRPNWFARYFCIEDMILFTY